MKIRSQGENEPMQNFRPPGRCLLVSCKRWMRRVRSEFLVHPRYKHKRVASFENADIYYCARDYVISNRLNMRTILDIDRNVCEEREHKTSFWGR